MLSTSLIFQSLQFQASPRRYCQKAGSFSNDGKCGERYVYGVTDVDWRDVKMGVCLEIDPVVMGKKMIGRPPVGVGRRDVCMQM